MKTFTFLSLLLFAFASAEMSFAVGDAKAGAQKAITCTACHGEKGMSMNPLWPNLAGQKKDYLIKQLKSFKSEKRKDPLMTPQAKMLSDKDIEDVSAYFSGIQVQAK